MQVLQRALRWGNVLLVLFTLAVYLTPYVDPRGRWPFSVLGLFYPAILFLHLLFILTWALWRKWYFALSLGCILVGWNHVRTVVGFSSAPGVIPEKAVKIMTFNCRSFSTDGAARQMVEKKAVTDLIRRHHPDILCFQEFANSSSQRETSREWIKAGYDYPYEYIQLSPSLAIFSRHPITERHTHKFENSYNGYQWADININGRMIRLFNLHLQTNAISGLADKVAASGDLKSKETWLDMGGMLKRYHRAARRRAGQAEEIRALAHAAAHPVFLCGDFNDVPQSYTYRVLQQDRTDTFRRAGSGLGVTYAGKIPGLRIDYILAPADFPVLETRILRPGFSDHRPVLSTVIIGGEE